MEAGASSWQNLLKSHAGAGPAWTLLQRRLQDAGRSALPAGGQALLIAHTSNPLRPAGASAAWSYLESALVVLRLPADPRAAPAEPTKPADATKPAEPAGLQ